MLLLISSLFKLVNSTYLEVTVIEQLFELFDSFIVRDDESIIVAKFLFKNKSLIFSSKLTNGLDCTRFWELLFQILIENSGESSQICSNIISSFSKIDTSNNEPMSMISQGLDICIENLANMNQSFEFLLNQYDFFSECESKNNDNEVL